MSPLKTINSNKFAVVAVLASGICFGTTGTSQSLYGKGINPLAIGSSRLLIGAIALWLLSIRDKTKLKFPKGQLWICAVGVAVYQLAFFSAVHQTGVAIATITALGSAPIFTGLFSWITGHEKPTKTWVIATSITTIGIFAINTHDAESQIKVSGILLALCAGAGFASFNVAGRKVLTTNYPLSHFISRSFALAALLISPFIFTQNLHWITTMQGTGLILWLGLVATALAYTLYSFGLTHIKASNASTLVLAEPVTATILSVTVLHYHLNFTSWLGVTLVISGLVYPGVNA